MLGSSESQHPAEDTDAQVDDLGACCDHDNCLAGWTVSCGVLPLHAVNVYLSGSITLRRDNTTTGFGTARGLGVPSSVYAAEEDGKECDTSSGPAEGMSLTHTALPPHRQVTNIFSCNLEMY